MAPFMELIGILQKPESQIHNVMLGPERCSVVKSCCSSSRGPGFSSLHPCCEARDHLEFHSRGCDVFGLWGCLCSYSYSASLPFTHTHVCAQTHTRVCAHRHTTHACAHRHIHTIFSLKWILKCCAEVPFVQRAQQASHTRHSSLTSWGTVWKIKTAFLEDDKWLLLMLNSIWTHLDKIFQSKNF